MEILTMPDPSKQHPAKDQVQTETEPAPKKIKVTGIFCFVQLSDGSLRQAMTSAIEHDRTILNVLQMNPQRALKLGSSDYSKVLEIEEKTVDSQL
jgi:hypothetical protein